LTDDCTAIGNLRTDRATPRTSEATVTRRGSNPPVLDPNFPRRKKVATFVGERACNGSFGVWGEKKERSVRKDLTEIGMG
jgi:hypothetical protein